MNKTMPFSRAKCRVKTSNLIAAERSMTVSQGRLVGRFGKGIEAPLTCFVLLPFYGTHVKIIAPLKASTNLEAEWIQPRW